MGGSAWCWRSCVEESSSSSKSRFTNGVGLQYAQWEQLEKELDPQDWICMKAMSADVAASFLIFLNFEYSQCQHNCIVVDHLRQDFNLHGIRHWAKGKIEQVATAGGFLTYSSMLWDMDIWCRRSQTAVLLFEHRNPLFLADVHVTIFSIVCLCDLESKFGKYSS